jgi:hypothetical protein
MKKSGILMIGDRGLVLVLVLALIVLLINTRFVFHTRNNRNI